MLNLNKIIHFLFFKSQQKNYVRFKQSLNDVEKVQSNKILGFINTFKHTELGQAFQFNSISNLKKFQALPETNYEVFQPFIASNKLCKDVKRHEPTSGSSSKRKWIPYNSQFLNEFDHASAPWIYDLCLQYPEILQGLHYWSLSWIPDELRDSLKNSSDADFLPWWKAYLMKQVLATPQNLGWVPTLEEHKQLTKKYLTESKNLSLVSVWSPTFLLNLLDEIGEVPFKQLKLVSCWDSGSSKLWADKIRTRLPHVQIQGKGLWATEGVVTIPFEKKYPLAINSHAYEFKCLDSNKYFFPWELKTGMTVNPLITCGNGFFRYNLKDQLVVDGFLGQTPCFTFLGRGQTIDLVGEKIDTRDILELFAQLRAQFKLNPICMIISSSGQPHYQVLIEGQSEKDYSDYCEKYFCQFHHYKVARSLGQLQTCQAINHANGLEYLKTLSLFSGEKSKMIEGDRKMELVYFN